MKRGSGILLHVTSLPSPYGIGDMGPGAYKFADFLHRTKQSYWQILPLSPTISESHSPYNGSSAFACNPLLISPDFLVRDGFLSRNDLAGRPDFPEEEVRFSAVLDYKEGLFRKAYDNYSKNFRECDAAMGEFCLESRDWLPAYASFSALKMKFGDTGWTRWKKGFRDKKPDALDKLGQEVLERIHFETFLQFIFARQWKSLKLYCNKLGIKVIGDMPYYVSHDSADVWTHPEIFKLNGRGEPTVVAGVPPDYFSSNGQLWGNPVFNWSRLKETGYAWWLRRFKRNLDLFDILRVDHFRGMVAYWEVPAKEKTAVKGRWVSCPVDDFFNTLFRHSPDPPLIAEDLGLITPDVREAIRELGFPGMRVILFAFGENPPASPHIPHRHERNCVVYTGTHDNNTVLGWFQDEVSPEAREKLFMYLGRRVPAGEVSWELIRLAMMSVARTVILPMQDVLGLGGQSRMNHPATVSGNWKWRLSPRSVTRSVEQKLLRETEIFGRD